MKKFLIFVGAFLLMCMVTGIAYACEHTVSNKSSDVLEVQTPEKGAVLNPGESLHWFGSEKHGKGCKVRVFDKTKGKVVLEEEIFGFKDLEITDDMLQ